MDGKGTCAGPAWTASVRLRRPLDRKAVHREGHNHSSPDAREVPRRPRPLAPSVGKDRGGADGGSFPTVARGGRGRRGTSLASGLLWLCDSLWTAFLSSGRRRRTLAVHAGP